ncbi:MAG: fibronectin type III domain-containing protein [Candidatus Nanopelagicales bacterium]
MGAQSSRFTGLVSGSGRATAAGAAVVCAMVVLAGCGGSAGSATSASVPVLRGDATATKSATPTATATATPTASETASVPLAKPGVPAAPTVVAGNEKVTVTVAPWASGGTPESYTVRALLSGFGSVGKAGTCTVTGARGSCEVTGLTNGVAYIAYATATNSAGTSASSKASERFTPAAGPGGPATPVLSAVVAGAGKVSVSVVPGTGGGTPTSHRVEAYTVDGRVAGTCTVTGASGSCDVTGLANGTRYQVRATAVNEVGSSGISGPSSPVTPVAA